MLHVEFSRDLLNIFLKFILEEAMAYHLYKLLPLMLDPTADNYMQWAFLLSRLQSESQHIEDCDAFSTHLDLYGAML